MLKMNKKKTASLGFDQIKNGKVASLNKNLPASCVFQKRSLRNTCLFLFRLKDANIFANSVDPVRLLISVNIRKVFC